jgi:hypothetical protein
LLHPNVNRATSKIFKKFSDEKFPSVSLNQTIRDVAKETPISPDIQENVEFA